MHRSRIASITPSCKRLRYAKKDGCLMDFVSVEKTYEYFNSYVETDSTIYFSCRQEDGDKPNEYAYITNAQYHQLWVNSFTGSTCSVIIVTAFEDAVDALLMLHDRHPSLPILYAGREYESYRDISRDPLLAMGEIGRVSNEWWQIISRVGFSLIEADDPTVIAVTQTNPEIKIMLDRL